LNPELAAYDFNALTDTLLTPDGHCKIAGKCDTYAKSMTKS